MVVSAVRTVSPADLLSSTATVARGKAKAATNATASTGSSLGSTTTGTTFLNLLVKELQNQDPTAPMDSTAMVGQMISLNQLDQLISINQNLTSSSGTAVKGVSGEGAATRMAQQSALLSSGSSGATQSSSSTLSNPNSTLDFSTLNVLNGGR